MKDKILIVDDLDVNREFLMLLLNNDYDILLAKNGEEAINIAKTQNVDLILLDIIMPDINGFDVCKKLKEDNDTKHIPIIFVTSKVDEASIVKGYECGGVDYVTKPYKKLELFAKIKTHLKIKHLIEELNYTSTHDVMTGIYNRREFFNIFYKKDKENLYIVMMDIDNFKNINDTYGHQTGDEVIKKFADIVMKSIKKDTIFARIGGEEFVLVCEYDNEEEMLKQIESIRKKIEQTPLDNKKLNFTVSIGITKVDKDKTIDEILSFVDKNMYEAKNKGKNQLVYKK